MSGNIPSAPPPSPKPPAPAPIQTSTTKPKWHERWRTGIRAAETAIVIGFWVAGVAALDEPLIAYLLFLGGAIIGSISIFAEPTRPLSQKIIWTTLLIFFFAFSSGFIGYHQIQVLAVSQGEEISQLEQDQGARIEITEIAPVSLPTLTKPTPFFLRISYKNSGNLAAESPNIFDTIIPSKDFGNLAGEKEEDAAMSEIIKESKSGKFFDSGNQLLQGDTAFITLGLSLSKSDYQAAQNQEYPIALGFVFIYTDASTPPGYAKYTYFCAHLIQDGAGGWEYCHSYNKVFVQKITSSLN